jgi:hypothetical protein
MRSQISNQLFSENFWNDKKSKLKDLYPILNDTDLVYEQGNLWELMNTLGTKLNKPLGEVREILTGL